MKLDSKECREALKRYKVENNMEELAIAVLLAKDEDVVDIPGILDLQDTQIDELARVIKCIRDIIGIEEEA
jgi:hypothetical protein